MDAKEIKDRIRAVGQKPDRKLKIFTDTTEFMNIERGSVIQFPEKNFYIMGNAFEGRFGIDDQPKFWVKKALDLDDGSKKIIKLVFTEEMTSSFGPFTFKSFRSGEKEGQVLDITKNDTRFMQGYTLLDKKHNQVRIIDFIEGRDLYKILSSYEDIPHEQYFNEIFPDLFRKFVKAIEAIAFLHKNGVCHGDIRTDHLFMDNQTGELRWIDFDLKQYVLAFDVWSIGNVLMFITGKEEVTFWGLNRGEFGSTSSMNIKEGDESAFFPHRLANLKKVYPYIPEQLNDILMRYSQQVCDSLNNYKHIDMVLSDLQEFNRNINN